MPLFDSSLENIIRPSPRFAIASIAGAVLIAIYTLPVNFAEAGALRVTAVILCAGFALPVALSALKDPRAALLPESVLSLAPIYWLLIDLITGRYRILLAGRNDVIASIGAAGLFSVMAWIAAMRRPKMSDSRMLVSLERRLPTRALFNAGIITFLLGITYFVAKAGLRFDLIVEGLMGSRFQAVWARRVAKGDWWAFVEHLTYFGMLLPAILVLVARRRGWLSIPSLLLMVFCLVFGAFLAQLGNRRYIGVMAGSGVVIWLLQSRSRTVMTLLKMAAAFIVMIVMLEYMYNYRVYGARMLQDRSLRQSSIRFDIIRVDDNFLRLAQTIAIVPQKAPYAYHSYVWFAIIRPIPRALWPDKPVAPGFRLHDHVRIGASLTSSVVGEGFASYGYVGVAILGLIYGYIGTLLLSLLRNSDSDSLIGLYSIGLLMLFAGFRSMIDLVSMSYVFFAALLLLTWLSKRSAKAAEKNLASRPPVIRWNDRMPSRFPAT